MPVVQDSKGVKMKQINRVITDLVTHEKTPLVLTIVSCTGVVATAVMVARAAPKASRVLAEVKAERMQDKLPPQVVFKHTWKIYAPAVSVGLITVGSIITMNRVNARNAAILSAGAALATNALKDYQQHVLEEIGAEKESKIRDRMAKDTLASSSTVDEDLDLFLLSGEGQVVCYDSLSGRYFTHNANDIRKVENDLNREIISNMSISLNDLYSALGIEEVEVGEILGFNIDNMIDFHFSAQLSPKKRPILVLSHINMPVPNFHSLTS